MFLLRTKTSISSLLYCVAVALRNGRIFFKYISFPFPVGQGQVYNVNSNGIPHIWGQAFPVVRLVKIVNTAQNCPFFPVELVARCISGNSFSWIYWCRNWLLRICCRPHIWSRKESPAKTERASEDEENEEWQERSTIGFQLSGDMSLVLFLFHWVDTFLFTVFQLCNSR